MIMRAADVDGSGSLSFTEFANAMIALSAGRRR